MEKMMATIKDVAKAAGVSIGTVSNIINGKTTARTDTYFRVQKAIAELNYRPSFSARNLRSNKSKLIGVLLPRLNQFYSEIYSGIIDQFRNTSYLPLLKLSLDDPAMESVILKDFYEAGVEGLILVPASSGSDQQLLEQLRGLQIPLVLADRNIPELSCDKIVFDNSTLLYQTAAPFAKKYVPEEIALVRLLENHSSELEAMDGFLHALPESPVYQVSPHRGEIFASLLTQFTALEHSLRVIVATNGDIALAAQDVCALLGWNTEIHALSGSSWPLSESDGSIRPIQRPANAAGRLAARRLSLTLTEADEHRCETIYVKKLHPHKQPDINLPDIPATIRVLCLDSGGADALETLSVPLSRNSGVRFEFDRKSYEGLKEALELELSGTSSYDILMIDKPWLQRCYQARLFTDLGSEITSEIALQYPTFIHKIFYENRFRPYCIPIIAGVQAVYYRADLFQDPNVIDAFWNATGTPLAPPSSWGEYARIASFFTGFHSASHDFSYGTLVKSIGTLGLVNEFLPRQWAFNGTLFTEKGRARLDTVENERALKNLCECWSYSDPSRAGTVFDEDIFEALRNGSVPMAIGFTNHRLVLDRQKRTFDNFLEAAPLPRRRAMVGGYLLGISRASEHPGICREYLRWVMSDTISVANMRMNGFIPTRAVYEDSYLTAINPWFSLLEQCSHYRCTRESVHTIMGDEVFSETLDEILSDMIREAISGKPCRTALKETEEKLNRIILC